MIIFFIDYELFNFLFHSLLKEQLQVLHPTFSGNHQEDASEFFVLFLNHVDRFLSQSANYILTIEESVACEECGFLRTSGIRNSIMMFECADYSNIDVPMLIQKSFEPSQRLSECESEICGKTKLHCVEKKIIEVPEILIIQLNRCDFDKNGPLKRETKVKVDEKLDLKCFLG